MPSRILGPATTVTRKMFRDGRTPKHWDELPPLFEDEVLIKMTRQGYDLVLASLDWLAGGELSFMPHYNSSVDRTQLLVGATRAELLTYGLAITVAHMQFKVSRDLEWLGYDGGQIVCAMAAFAHTEHWNGWGHGAQIFYDVSYPRSIA